MLVRPAKTEELAPFIAISRETGWHQLNPREREHLTPDSFLVPVTGMFHHALATPGGTMLVAEEDGRPIGYILYSLRPNGITGQMEGFFFDQYVDPAHRHRGVAQELNARAMEHCRQLGATGVTLLIAPHNEASRKAASRSGFNVERLVFGRAL